MKSEPGQNEPVQNESLLSIYERARRFGLWSSLLVLLLSALSVGALTWQAARASQAAAATAVSSFELKLDELIEGVERGQRRPGQVSSFEVDLEGRVRQADPAWLGDLSLAHNRAFLLAKPLQVGQIQVVFSPDPADMSQRVALWVRRKDGLSVATYRPENLFVPGRGSPEILVLDQRRICQYSDDSTLLHSEVAFQLLAWRRGRLLLSEGRDLAQTKGYRLVVREDVTQEAWLIAVFCALALGFLFLIRAWASRLASDFEVLEAETRAVGAVIGSLSGAPGRPGSLRDHLSAPLAAARQAELRFVENRSNVNLICALGEEVLGLVEHLEGRTQELHESERRLESALQRAPIPLVLRAGEDELLLVNAAWRERSGYAEQPLSSLQDWLALAHPGQEGARELYGEGAASTSGSLRVTSATGEVLTWELASAPIGTLADGRALSVILADDVTERNRVEAQSRLADKLRAVGELAGGVAHDFNNQLMAITASTELLARQFPDAREQFDLILLASARSAELTEQLLAFARQGKHLDRAVDLHALIDEVAALLSRSVDKRVQIERRLEATSPWVRGDPAQLQSAILNLGLNAGHAMPEGGTVTFVARDAPQERLMDEEGDSTPCLELLVSDIGEGIPPELREQIFEPFFTTKGLKGTGLGLAAVYGTVQSHGGRIEVESEVGVGSTFRVLLPLAEPAPLSSPSSPSEVSRSPSRSLRSLVVDDEPLVRRLLARFLEVLGHEVVATAATGSEAIELFRATPDAFEFVVLDLGLPDMGGGDVLRELLSLRPELPVVIASGYAENEIAEDLIERGAKGFLRKPFETSSLSLAIEQALR